MNSRSSGLNRGPTVYEPATPAPAEGVLEQDRAEVARNDVSPPQRRHNGPGASGLRFWDYCTRVVTDTSRRRAGHNHTVWTVTFDCGHLSMWRHAESPEVGGSGLCNECMAVRRREQWAPHVCTDVLCCGRSTP